MDFHSLARKELQALCKKNKIPANITNVAMADALKSLEMVEGLDELMNAARSDTSESEPKTACRTSTRRKPINVEPESSQPLTRTRRAARRTVGDGGEQENKNVNLPETPAIPASRRRAPATLARQKIDMEKKNEAPGISTKKKSEALKSAKSTQRVYGTRQSVSLVEKSMADLSLMEKRRVEVVKIEGLGDEAEEIEQKEDIVTGGESEIVSSQDMNESVEENKSYDHEVNDSEVISDQKLVQSLENESIIKDEVEEDNKSNEREVDEDSGVSVQHPDESMHDESEVKVELPEDSKNVDPQAESDVISENCIKLDDPLDVDGEDETSRKVTDMNPDSIDEKGPVAGITAQSDKIQDPLTLIETSQLVEEKSETDSTEEDGHDDDMLSESDDSDGSETEEASSDEESLSEGTELDETSDDSETDEVPDGSLAEEVGDNEITEETHEGPLLPGVDCEDSQMRDEPKGNVSDPENAVANECVETVVEMEKTPLKQQQLSPCNKVAEAFSANTMQGQFPRPTKKVASNQKTIHPDIINKENIDTSSKKAEQKMKKKKQKGGIEDPEKMSLRQMRKALKSLNISKGEKRTALQKLADHNCAEEAEDRS